MTPVETLLDRLEAVRETGPGRWVARCPAHRDRRPSLSIREGDVGRVLLYCFAGCPVEEIVSGVGLELSDLFPPNLGGDYDRRNWKRRQAPPIPAAHALRLLDREAYAVLAMARKLRECELLTEEECADVELASQRIGDVLHLWEVAP